MSSPDFNAMEPLNSDPKTILKNKQKAERRLEEEKNFQQWKKFAIACDVDVSGIPTPLEIELQRIESRKLARDEEMKTRTNNTTIASGIDINIDVIEGSDLNNEVNINTNDQPTVEVRVYSDYIPMGKYTKQSYSSDKTNNVLPDPHNENDLESRGFKMGGNISSTRYSSSSSSSGISSSGSSSSSSSSSS